MHFVPKEMCKTPDSDFIQHVTNNKILLNHIIFIISNSYLIFSNKIVQSDNLSEVIKITISAIKE